ANAFTEIAKTISLIKDELKRSEYTRIASHKFNIEEIKFLGVINKLIQDERKKKEKSEERNNVRILPPQADEEVVEDSEVKGLSSRELESIAFGDASQEKEIIRLLLLYGSKMIDWDGIANTYIGPFMVAELGDVEFEHPPSKKFVEMYGKELENGVLPDEQFFIHYPDKEIVDLTVTLLATKYTLSENWYEMHKILVPDEQVNMKATILGAIFHLKKHKVGKILDGLRAELQTAEGDENTEILLTQYMQMKKVEKSISDYLGSVIIK
ncbi:MAG TPA: hypothetical protein VK671_03900, partial [Mucilaginibacter sp.]|nr:hypothetical protein [Mucilaginibacter sp.]